MPITLADILQYKREYKLSLYDLLSLIEALSIQTTKKELSVQLRALVIAEPTLKDSDFYTFFELLTRD